MQTNTLLLDMDGPLADFDRHFYEKCVELGYSFDVPGLEHQRHRFFTEHMVDKAERAAAREMVDSAGWFESLPVVEGAVEGVRELIEYGVDVWVCTKPLEVNPTCRDAKAAWLREHLPELEHKLIIAPDKALVVGDVLLDDAPHLGQIDRAVWKPLVFTAPYNQGESEWHDLPHWTWADGAGRLLTLMGMDIAAGRWYAARSVRRRRPERVEWPTDVAERAEAAIDAVLDQPQKTPALGHVTMVPKDGMYLDTVDDEAKVIFRQDPTLTEVPEGYHKGWVRGEKPESVCYVREFCPVGSREVYAKMVYNGTGTPKLDVIEQDDPRYDVLERHAAMERHPAGKGDRQAALVHESFLKEYRKELSEARGHLPRVTTPDPAPGEPDTTNPKDLLGIKKPQLHLVPRSFIIRVAQAMTDGAKKYGPYNWREKAVRATVYQSAAERHLAQWLDGEDNASDSGVHHLAHAGACIGILIDAIETGNLVDDRPTPGPAARLIAELTES